MVRDVEKILRLEDIRRYLLVPYHFYHVNLGTVARLNVLHHDFGDRRNAINRLDRAKLGLEELASAVVKIALDGHQ